MRKAEAIAYVWVLVCVAGCGDDATDARSDTGPPGQAPTPDAAADDYVVHPTGPCLDVGEPFTEHCEDGFCLESPRTPIADPVVIAGSSERDIWLLGRDGTLAHRGCEGWAVLPDAIVPAPSCVPVHDDCGEGEDEPVECGFPCTMAARAPDDAWLSTREALFHWDGVRWQPSVGPVPAQGRAVWLASSGELWLTARGSSSLLALRREGEAWVRHAGGALDEVLGSVTALDGSAADDVWAIGDARLLHFDGAIWESVSDAVGSEESLAAFAPDDVWLGRYTGSVKHWDGTRLRDMGATGDVVGVAPGDVFVFAYDGPPQRFASTEFRDEPHPSGGGLGTRRAFAGHAWVADYSGAVTFFDEGAWRYALGDSVYVDRIAALHGSAEDDIWAIMDSGEILQHGNGGFEVVHELNLEPGPWDQNACCDNDPAGYAVFARGKDDAWIAGRQPYVGSVLTHWDGARWTEQRLEGAALTQIWSPATNALWAVIDRQLREWNGTKWIDHEPLGGSGAVVESVWGSGRNQVWAAGTRRPDNDAGTGTLSGFVAKYDGRDWTEIALPSGTPPLAQVIGSGADELWVLATDRALRRDGDSWKEATPPLDFLIDGKLLYVGDDLVFCDDDGTAFLWSDGDSAWTSDLNVRLCPTWGTSLDAAWSVQGRGQFRARAGVWRSER